MTGVLIDQTTSEGQLDPVPLPLLETDRVFITRGTTTYKGSMAVLLAWVADNLADVDLSGYVTISSIVNSLTSTANNVPLAADQGQVLKQLIDNLTVALALKLDVSAYNQYNKGVFSSLIQLNTTHPTALAGSYALVDTGVGNEADFYWFDLDDGWVTNGGISLANTDALVEGSSNLYFTNARAIAAVTATINAAVAASLEPTINTQTVTAYTVGTVSTNNDGKTILRMDNASANTVEITTAQTKPISIRQAGTGTTTLVAGSGVTLNGTLAFTARHQTKTIYRVSSGIYDVVG